jgi:folate-binding protein YgfZ
VNARLRLPHLAVLRLSGADRVALLQGQTSNDARRVTPTLAQLTSFNNPKGRCYAIAVLAEQDGSHLLIVERSVAETLCKRLRMYILRSKVTVEVAEDLALIGRPGDHRAAATDPSRGLACAAVDDGLAVEMPGARELVVVPVARAAPLADGSDAWRLADVQTGVPTVVAETVERFVPLWLGLERLGAIDYKKGCYTGQEIVARTHYLGTVKQRLLQARSPAAALPGAKVLGPDGDALGEVVSGAPEGAGFALLFVARDGDAYRLAEPPVALDGIRSFDHTTS